jgi:hypothetical protein
MSTLKSSVLQMDGGSSPKDMAGSYRTESLPVHCCDLRKHQSCALKQLGLCIRLNTTTVLILQTGQALAMCVLQWDGFRLHNHTCLCNSVRCAGGLNSTQPGIQPRIASCDAKRSNILLVPILLIHVLAARLAVTSLHATVWLLALDQTFA